MTFDGISLIFRNFRLIKPRNMLGKQGISIAFADVT
jgi:hypothetical protein